MPRALSGLWMTVLYPRPVEMAKSCFVVWILVFGAVTSCAAGAHDGGLGVNLTVAEYVIRRRPADRSNRTSAGLVGPQWPMRSRDEG